MAEYILEIYRLDSGVFTRIDTLITYSPFSWGNSLCGVGGLVFNLNVYDTHATGDNLVRFRNHVAVKRNGVVVWFGPITDITVNYQDVEGSLRIECNTMLSHFLETNNTGRYTNKLQTYTAVEQATIAWDLINTTQSKDNGSLGITQGASPTSILRDRTYEYANIGSALIELSEILGGVEFEFMPTVDGAGLVTGVVFNCFYPNIGQLRTDLNALRVGDNIQSITLKTYRPIANSGTSEGAGTGTPITSTLDFGASQVAYTRRETIYPQKSVSLLDTLSANLEALLTFRSVENYAVTVTLYPDTLPELGTYILGDRLYVDLGITGSGYLSGVKEARVIALTVDVDDVGREVIKPTLELYN